MGNGQSCDSNALTAQECGKPLYARGFSRNYRLRRRVVGGNVEQIAIQPSLDFFVAEADGSHRAWDSGELRHQQAALAHNAKQSVLFACAGPVQRSNLAQA